MPTLTPTKDTGGTAKASDVVYVEPERTVTDADLAKMIDIDGANAAFVADLLSACLAHERCGTHLYRSVAGRTNNAILKAKYEEFGDETLRHVGILEELVASLGGNPSYVSPLARAVEAADTKALESTYLAAGGLDPMAMEMAMLDAVFKAETIDHANWQTLGQLADALPKGAARKALERAVSMVEPDEDDHLTWAQDTRARLTMLQASSSVMAKAGAKAERLMAEVKGWLTGTGTGKGATAPAKKAPTRKGPAKSASKQSAAKKGATAAKTAAKPATAKKAATKRASTAKATGAQKTASKKTAAKKTAAKKTAAKKTAAKKTAAKKTAAKKTAAKKTAAKKTAAKKTAAKKAPAKKSAAKKAAAKRSTGRTAKR